MPRVGKGNIDRVFVSFASDTLHRHIIKNKMKFNLDDILLAIKIFQNYGFNMSFLDTPPLSFGSEISPDQQSSLQGIKLLGKLKSKAETDGKDFGDCLIVGDNGKVRFWELYADIINNLLSEIVGELIKSGMLPTSSKARILTAISLTDLQDSTLPSAPGNLKADLPVAYNKVVLSWTAGTDNSAKLAWYAVKRSDKVEPIATVNSGMLTFTDNSVAPNSPYTYVVQAITYAGFTADSSPLSVTTGVIPPRYNITGSIKTADGVALPGVNVAVSGAGSGVFKTDTNGNYTIKNVLAGKYTITPSLVWYAFTPESKDTGEVAADISGIDFTAVALPVGTIIGGISYPSGMVIGGVTYPTATVIGGVVYPTGAVVGGVTYPNGVVIAGVSYPAGTIVGGTAYPVGSLTVGTTYPSGVIIGGVTYPASTIVGGISFPLGTLLTGTTYPTGAVAGSMIYPNGFLTTILLWPTPL
jgi:hypothetical protein